MASNLTVVGHRASDTNVDGVSGTASMKVLTLHAADFGTRCVCTGDQVRVVIEIVAGVLPELRWYGSDVEAVGEMVPGAAHPDFADRTHRRLHPEVIQN